MAGVLYNFDWCVLYKFDWCASVIFLCFVYCSLVTDRLRSATWFLSTCFLCSFFYPGNKFVSLLTSPGSSVNGSRRVIWEFLLLSSLKNLRSRRQWGARPINCPVRRSLADRFSALNICRRKFHHIWRAVSHLFLLSRFLLSTFCCCDDQQRRHLRGVRRNFSLSLCTMI